MISFTDQPVTDLREAMTFADYCDFPALNQSRLKDFDYDLGGCPALFRHRMDHPDERRESDALATGRRYHHFLLQPDSFDDFYATLTPEIEAELFAAAIEGGSKAKGFSASLSTYKAWENEQVGRGREVVTVSDSAQLHAMRAAVASDAEVMAAIGADGAKTEVSALCGYKLPSGKFFQLKARFDMLPGGDALIDLKTARTVEPRKFANQVFDLGYDLQAAFYVDAARRNKLPVTRFGFLAQDKFPPYLPCIHWMPNDWLRYGRIRYQVLLGKIAECLADDKWPGRKSGELEPPFRAQLEIDQIAA